MTHKEHSVLDQLHLVLDSEMESLKRAVVEVERFMHEMDITDGNLVYRSVLLTSEAVSNAIKHGNEEDASKQVTVDLVVYSDRIVIKVEDEGHGFDREAVEDPRETSNLLREGGRGIFLIEEVADAVEYELKGRRVCMIVRR